MGDGRPRPAPPIVRPPQVQPEGLVHGAEGHHHGAVLEEEALEEAVTIAGGQSWQVGFFAEEAKAGGQQPGRKRLVAVLWSELTRGKRSIRLKL